MIFCNDMYSLQVCTLFGVLFGAQSWGRLSTSQRPVFHEQRTSAFLHVQVYKNGCCKDLYKWLKSLIEVSSHWGSCSEMFKTIGLPWSYLCSSLVSTSCRLYRNRRTLRSILRSRRKGLRAPTILALGFTVIHIYIYHISYIYIYINNTNNMHIHIYIYILRFPLIPTAMCRVLRVVSSKSRLMTAPVIHLQLHLQGV